jgi:hypothetical protein
MSRHETAIRIRAAAQDDLGILWDFLAIAAYEADIAAAQTVPFVAAHLEGWQRSEDFGFIAETPRRSAPPGRGNSRPPSNRRFMSTAKPRKSRSG